MRLWVIAFLIISCSTSSNSFMSGMPSVAPIVNAAAPSSLRATSSSSALNHFLRVQEWAINLWGIPSLRAAVSASTVATELTAFFKGTYGKLSGGNAVGFINALLEDLDYRMTELKNRSSGMAPSCTTATPGSYTVDGSFIDNTFKLSIDVQCSSLFSGAGDQSYSGSGMVFGKSTTGSYSLWLGLNHDASSGFGYAANVVSPDSASDKAVDMIYMEGESQYSRGSVARLKAKPSTSTYELVFVSNAPYSISPISGDKAYFGCGLNMISNGTLIYISGSHQSTGSSCSSSSEVFTTCLNATDLSENSTSGACTTLSSSFTISTDLTTISYSDVATPSSSETRIHDAIQISNANSKVSEFK